MTEQKVEIPHEPPPGFRIRDATLADVGAMTDVWYTSFYRTHKFFQYATPDTPTTRKWFDRFWAMGIEAGPDVVRTFVAEDLTKNNNNNNKIVGFSRWHVPQADGNQDVPFPPFPEEWDPEINDALWGGMARSRLRVMGKRPHWMAEFIAVDSDYQKKGLALPFFEWAQKQAIAANIPMYGDASMKGLPVWKHYGTVEKGLIEMPKRPETYGSYEAVAVYWEPGMTPVEMKKKKKESKL